jgi:hypothetical protein
MSRGHEEPQPSHRSRATNRPAVPPRFAAAPRAGIARPSIRRPERSKIERRAKTPGTKGVAIALIWDGKDDRIGSLAAPGIYFYRMEAGDHRQEGKIAVVR